jgi:predicted RNA binding protein YcfA (HicA-like mRNA interferase family)
MKVRDVIRLLESKGWQHVRTSGSHRIFKHPNQAKLVTVAGKPGEDIPTGTLRTILKDSGVEGK